MFLGFESSVLLMTLSTIFTHCIIKQLKINKGNLHSFLHLISLPLNFLTYFQGFAGRISKVDHKQMIKVALAQPIYNK